MILGAYKKSYFYLELLKIVLNTDIVKAHAVVQLV
jgi:hypothetical protein